MGTMRLPVRLTDAEQIAAGKDLAARNIEEAAILAEKQAANEGFAERLKEVRINIRALSFSVKDGTAEREIETRVEEDHLRGVIRTVRLDTNEIHNERPMDDEERQLKLDAGLRKAREAERKGQAPTEEQQEASTPEEAEDMRERRLKRERRERAIEAIEGVISDAIVLPCDGDGHEGAGFRAGMPARPPLWPEAIEAKGDTEHEARSILRDKIVDAILATEDAAAAAKTERVMARLGGLLATAQHQHVTADELPDVFVSRVDTERWVCEETGDTAEEAADRLRAKLLNVLQCEQAEIDQLAADQAADAAKSGPKRLLRAPKGAKSKRLKVIDGDGNPLPTDEVAPGPAPEVDVTPPEGVTF